MTLEERIIESLDKIRPYIQRDGGDMEFVSVDEHGVVTVKLLGACIGCGLIDYTLKGGVEALLMDEIPEVTGVIAQDYFE
ncbi:MULTISPECIES: NifU family protein [unclassified Erysipelothrix]|uniref:NifU family protein n=1 Tax=unclassified Erysipelothrix TaxID=2624170 RepID=UPI0013778030|nr:MULTISPECIES: NifU family protein [unclassified Erysipelothrix]MBK2402690.1 NifU family protein [Erysipelothrix sp. strain 2 (EsS2-6-Brazil)]MBK2403579.1 NifU family protein [Erysipelothrix sp. strain 2 (EsS2-7-Brazil)]NBA02040.1 NifU family protein [Erysipelothrix rhusiopathiae]